jgi:uncharacterized small protein (DUF1192 family)
MLAFMDQEYRSWPIVTGNPDPSCYASRPKADLSYDTKTKVPLGIDYGSCNSWERQYAYTIVCWMALKVGARRRTFKSGIRLEHPAPFTVYDGIEIWPLIVGTSEMSDKLSPELQFLGVDELGIQNGFYAEEEFVQNSQFTLPASLQTIRDAAAKADAAPLKNERAWKRAYNEELLKDPALRSHMEHHLALLRAEIARLEKQWAVFDPSAPKD